MPIGDPGQAGYTLRANTGSENPDDPRSPRDPQATQAPRLGKVEGLEITVGTQRVSILVEQGGVMTALVVGSTTETLIVCQWTCEHRQPHRPNNITICGDRRDVGGSLANKLASTVRVIISRIWRGFL